MNGPADKPPHDVDNHRVRVEPGEHLVVRLGGLIAIIAGTATSARTTELLELLRAAAQAPGPLTGPVLSARLTDWLAETADAPTFGTAAGCERGLALFLYGDAHATIDDETKPGLSGREGAQAVERVLPWPASSVRLSIGRSAPVRTLGALPPWAGLQAGVTPGGALLLEVDRTGGAMQPHGAGRTDGTTQPHGAGQSHGTKQRHDTLQRREGASTEPLLAERIDGAVHEQPRPPLPIAGAGAHRPQRERQQEAAERAKTRPGAYVRGFRCSRGHLNDPRVSFCGVCGIRMDQLTGVMVLERRPPLGLFVLDAGSTFVLDDNYIIGRAPEASPSVRNGTHRPIRIDDASGSTSRVHSEVRLIEWDVLLVDLGSANGTYIAGAQDVYGDGAPRWTRLVPHRPFVLSPGTSVLIGRRQFIYESASARL